MLKTLRVVALVVILVVVVAVVRHGQPTATDPYTAGHQAATSGLLMSACPYQRHGDAQEQADFEAWRAGWQAGYATVDSR